MQAAAAIDEAVWPGLKLTSESGIPVAQVALYDHVAARPGERVAFSLTLDLSALNPGAYQLAYKLGTEGGPPLEGIDDLLYIRVHPPEWAAHERRVGAVNWGRMADADEGPTELKAVLHRRGDEALLARGGASKVS
jgi:hypothetical protein